MKKTLLILLCLPLLYYCSSKNNLKEIIIDIKQGNYNDSIHFNKDVNVIYLQEFWGGDDGYLVDMYFNGNDTLRNAKVFLGTGTEDIYDKAKYNWITDTSINITLYDSKGDSSVSFYAAGTMDGRGSAMGDLDYQNTYETVDKNRHFREQVNTGNFLKLSNGYTYYEIKNKNSINTLIFIHGFSVPSYIWDGAFNSASKKGYKTIRLDLYGRGYSSNLDVDYTDELFANQVIELMNELDVQKATLIGLSNGGRVISKIAYLKPEIIERLIYVAASSFQDHSPPFNKSVSKKEVNDFISNKYTTISEGQLLDFKYPQNFIGWDKKYESLLQYKGFARALISTRKNHVNLDVENNFINNSEIPFFTIWGDSDSVVVYSTFKEKLNKLMPRRIEYFISESGHLPNMENKIEFEDLLFNQILIKK